MAGKLVGLVLRHGPRNPQQRYVLAVIAEELRGPLRTTNLADSTIVDRTGLARSTVKVAIRGLRDDGWIGGRRGTYTSTASTYCLDLNKYPEDAVAALFKEGSGDDPSLDSPQNRQGSGDDPSFAERGREPTREGSGADPSSVPSELPSVSPPLKTAPEPRPWDADDDELAIALKGLPGVAWSPEIRAAIGWSLVERGHTPTSVSRYLNDINPDACRDVTRVVLAKLRDLPIRTEPTRDTGPLCAECFKPEPECRRIPESVSGHTFVSLDDRTIVDAADAGLNKRAASGGADEKRNGREWTPPADWVEKFNARRKTS